MLAVLLSAATAFFALFRYVQPAERAFFLASRHGVVLLTAEGAIGVLAAVTALLLWRRPGWWPLERLRLVEYALVATLAVYVGWTQAYSFQGVRFAPDGVADAYAIRLATESMAVRWALAIVALATVIPETLRRSGAIVAAQAALALAITAAMAVGDPVYRPHAGRVVALMAFWLLLAATVAMFGTAKLAELRQQVAEARRLGQYQLVRRIGSGGMGEVHLAEHLLLKEPVAIKLIRPDRAGDPEALARFEREVRATARLKHWNTVQIFDYGFTDDGTFYYVMEYLPGMTLDQIVQCSGPLPAGRVIHLLRQVCAALREAHGMQLVHRDVKPANVMVCERGGVHDVVKLLDFGLVRGGGPHAETVHDSHQILGTPGYMSPEQARGQGAPDVATDIYAVGATAYLLLTGQPAFEPGHAVQVLIAQATTDPEPPRHRRAGVPEDIDAIVIRCLDREPARRFATVDALDAALAACREAGAWTAADAAAWWAAHRLPAEAAANRRDARPVDAETLAPGVPPAPDGASGAIRPQRSAGPGPADAGYRNGSPLR